MAQFHIDANCCPICEEKLHFDTATRRWTLKTLHDNPQATLESISDFRFFFKPKDHAMRWHILRVHLRPYMCPSKRCVVRLEKRQLTTHFAVHRGEQFDVEAIFKEHTNFNYPELRDLLANFHKPQGAWKPPTKAEMKGFLFWDKEKIYDCEDDTDRKFFL
jgi:hypothetical protein